MTEENHGRYAAEGRIHAEAAGRDAAEPGIQVPDAHGGAAAESGAPGFNRGHSEANQLKPASAGCRLGG